ncbi:MAG: ATP-binding protein [Verrucomicrobiia bacterium]
MKTLLVQDHASQTLLRQFLLARGHEVAFHTSISAAQQEWERAHQALIVLDLADLSDALSFCRWLGGQAARNRMFLAAAMPSGEPDQASELLKAGADEVISNLHDTRALHVRLASIENRIRQRQEWMKKIDDLNTRAHQQVAIAALGQCALAHDLPVLLDLTSEFVLRVLGVDSCAILERLEAQTGLRFLAGFGWRPGEILPSAPANSPIGRTLEGEHCLIADLEHDPRFDARDLLSDAKIASAITIAVKGEAKGVFGVLCACSSQPREFVEDELRFLEGLANILGAVMERKRIEAEVQSQQTQVQHLQRLESVGQMAASLAHDYNNVLTIIHGHVTLALGDPTLPHSVANSLKTTLEAVERAADLTRHLLSFSRKQEIELKPVDLNTVIAGAAKLLDRVLGPKVRLVVDCCSSDPVVQADTGMLDQVLLNLAVNARDAMPKGGSLRIATSLVDVDLLHAQAQPGARQGEFVCLGVSDTGCGIAPETLRHIFDPFFTTKAPGKGTGLGLSTVFGIVKQHQGWIEVESERGKGATFRVYLPTVGKRARPEASAAPPGLAGSGVVILLIEDEITLRQLTRLLLENLGHEVLEAATGAEAVQVWKEQRARIQLLFTDLVLPDGVTGFEIAEQFLKDQPALRVILTSGYSADRVRDRYPGIDRVHFLKKPYSTASLQRAIDSCRAAAPIRAALSPMPAA